MNDAKQADGRREFLTLAAAGAATGFGALLPVAGAAAAVGTMPADLAGWFESIPGKHRQVADWPDLNEGMGLAYSLAFLLSAPAGYGCAPGDCGAVLVLRHHTIPLALTDAMWAKYRLGELFHVQDPDTQAPAVRNPYYLKPGGLPFPDMALSKLIERGVKVALCNLAVTFYSSVAAQKAGLKHEDVKQDWLANVHPGIKLMPSGVFATHAAQANGCHYVFAG